MLSFLLIIIVFSIFKSITKNCDWYRNNENVFPFCFIFSFFYSREKKREMWDRVKNKILFWPTVLMVGRHTTVLFVPGVPIVRIVRIFKNILEIRILREKF